MIGFAYLGALLISLAGLAVLDWRYKLAMWADARRAVVTIASAVVVFLLWDGIGVALGIFFRGDAPYMTGLVVAPEIPVEEVLFLTLLCYQTLLLWVAFSRQQVRRRRRA
ncbi:MAG: lycopene cyclase domain-containing protein [Actinobacteria bacterium HGW-Actinobacteria-4]|nr:MAG: lycopene cyclase domain-containing protein [Actinobacteria bacterium HGW-Actinobacteria-4]